MSLYKTPTIIENLAADKIDEETQDEITRIKILSDDYKNPDADAIRLDMEVYNKLHEILNSEKKSEPIDRQTLRKEQYRKMKDDRIKDFKRELERVTKKIKPETEAA